MVCGLFGRLLPRLFINAFVFWDVAVATAGSELTARRAPEIALVSVHGASELDVCRRCWQHCSGLVCAVATTATNINIA